jgi:RepB plasmid partitioning protein
MPSRPAATLFPRPKTLKEIRHTPTPRSFWRAPPKLNSRQDADASSRAARQRESANLDREFRLIEESYGPDHLDLVLAKGYLGRLANNERVARYLELRHKEILSEFIQIAE